MPGVTEDWTGGQCGCAGGSRWESQGGRDEEGWSRRRGHAEPLDCWKVGLSGKWDALAGSQSAGDTLGLAVLRADWRGSRGTGWGAGSDHSPPKRDGVDLDQSDCRVKGRSGPILEVFGKQTQMSFL